MGKVVALYDQFNRPMKQERPKKPITEEFPEAPIREGFRQYPIKRLSPEMLNQVFMQADMGNTYEQCDLYVEAEERFPHLSCEWSKRRNVISASQFILEPASDDSDDQKVYEFIKGELEGINNLNEMLLALQEAVKFGFSGIENIWDASEGQAVIVDFKQINARRFVFWGTDKDGHTTGIPCPIPRLMTDEDASGIVIPPWKMTFRGYNNEPYRAGLFRSCLIMYMMQYYAIIDWSIYNEHFGMPYVIAYYDQTENDIDKAELYKQISSLASNSRGILPKETELKFEHAAQSGGTASALYKELALYCNSQVSKVLLGQTLSADTGNSAGSYALAKIHDGVRKDILEFDARCNAEIIRNQIIRPLVGFNFGWDKALPKYHSTVVEFDDTVKYVKVIQTLHEMGLPLSESALYGMFAVTKPLKGEKILPKPEKTTPGSGDSSISLNERGDLKE